MKLLTGVPGGEQAQVEVLRELGLPTIVPPALIPTNTALPSPTLTPTGTPTPTRTSTSTYTPTSSATFTPSATASRSLLPTAGNNVSPVAILETAGDAEFQEISTATAGRLTLLDQATPPQGRVQAAVFLSDSSQLGVLSAGKVWLYKLTPKRAADQLLGQSSLLLTLYSSDRPQSLAALSGNQLLIGWDDGSIQVWGPGSQNRRWKGASGGAPVAALAASPDGRWVAAGTSTGLEWRTFLWSTDEKGYPEVTLEPDDTAASPLAFSPDGLLLARGMTGPKCKSGRSTL